MLSAPFNSTWSLVGCARQCLNISLKDFRCTGNPQWKTFKEAPSRQCDKGSLFSGIYQSPEAASSHERTVDPLH